MLKELISIIVPVYNVEKYVNRCIESILQQSYKYIEIILIDDGSTDNSGKICDEWAKKDKRIIVIHKKNGGVSSARNLGLDIAKGEYIGFVDSDDYIDERMFELLINKLLETESDMCFCNGYYVENTKKAKMNLNYNDISDKRTIMQKMFENNHANFAVWNKLIKKDCLKQLRFNLEISIYEDALFNFEYLDRINKIAFVKECLYFYDVSRESSTLHENNIKKKITILDSMIKIIKILEKNNIKELYNQQCIFIGRVYNYEKIARKEKLEIDFSLYKNFVKEYVSKGLLKKRIGIRNKIKVIYCILGIFVF